MLHFPTKDQWQALFVISEKIKMDAPWKRFQSNEIITIKKSKEEEPIFCSILGEDSDHYGVAVFFGYQALAGFFQLLSLGKEIPFSTFIAYQNCLTVYFADRSALGNGDFSAMEIADYPPQPGPIGHTFFRSYLPGYAPWYLESSEVKRLTHALEHLNETLAHLNKEGGNHSLQKGETICYQELADGTWELTTERLPVFSIEYQTIQFEDELFIARLKRLPKTARCLEVDINYMPNPLTAKYSFRPLFPRICIIADHDGGFIDHQQVLEEQQNHNKALLELLLENIRENGRPRLILVRPGPVCYILKDLCKKIGTKLEERPGLEIIDDFMSLLGNFPNKE